VLQELGRPTIKQEVIVRWLSMSQLLESILASYSTLTTLASEKGTLHHLPTIDVSAVAAIVGLFSPWKHVMERVQATNTPSLHLVVTSYWYILQCLIVTDDESADKTAKGN
jgi:aminoglycoside/choline kinase family phosphotransferase